MSVIKFFGGTKNAFKRYQTDLNAFTKSVHDTAYYNANGMGLYYAFFGAQVLFLLPAAIIMLNHTDDYAAVLPKILFFLVVCAGLKEPLENMMNVSIDSTKINVGLKRIDELLSEPEIALTGDGKSLTKYDIAFEDVSFAYPGSGIYACSKVSFHLPQGSCNALVRPSGGGKQRISIARAILSDAPIVFLDEATASLDPENEVLIQHAIDELVKNKTVLVMAHRLQSVMHADDIIVLDQGTIIEQGTHTDLLKKGGKYAALWKNQQTAGNWKMTI